ncbi:carbohydrate-selective porin OprB [Calothrix sp. NIES-4071]|nr:carbohydrate-selective porin OprB [Calothrix sp. NIES-4071]BAZ62052.1 carbohydrate-selective porin OprB [Calothrix sp. NIES-4105]
MIKPIGVSEKKLMTKLFWNVIKLAPVLVAATFITANGAFAAEANETSVAKLSEQANNIGQVTSVSQFSDVQPTDWAFQALQSLVERYGCIAGYPGGTFRGNRALTRYEFAAGLNACLDRVNELIATATADLVKKEDIEALQRLREDFADELAALRGKVDELDARTTTLEAKQFSTTTKLVGEAIFSVSDTFGDDSAVSSRTLINNPVVNGVTPTAARPNRLDSNTTFSDRIRLSLNSSFTGTDALQIRLQAGNVLSNNSAGASTAPVGTSPSTGTAMTRLAYDNNTSAAGNGNAQAVQIDKINYAFNLSDKVRVKVDANNGEFWENINNFNPDLASSSRGSISRYGRFSPIYRQGAGGAGATVTLNPSGNLSASFGYLAGGSNNVANDPSVGRGLTDGNYAALGQLAYKFNDAFSIGGTYVRSYQNAAGVVSFSGTTGSDLANQPLGNIPTSANHYGIQANYKFNPQVALGGWVGFSNTTAELNGNLNPASSTALTGTALSTAVANGNVVRKGDSADMFYWAANLTVKDFIKEGNLLALTFGQPPKVTSSDFRPTVGSFGRIEQKDAGTSYHLEALYRMQINSNITVAPSLLVIFNPEHNDRNDTIYVGTLRTTFTF